MCHPLPFLPHWLPELNALAGFKVTEKRKGLHVAHNNFVYQLQTMCLDPNAIRGDHGRCLHVAFDQTSAEQNLLGLYGSHLLFCALIPDHFWSRGSGDQACLHADRTVPLACLTCEDGEFEPAVQAHWPEPLTPPFHPHRRDLFSWIRRLPVDKHHVSEKRRKRGLNKRRLITVPITPQAFSSLSEQAQTVPGTSPPKRSA